MSRAVVLACLTVRALLSQSVDGLAESIREGDKALAESRYADAERSFTAARQLAPRMADIYGRLGLVYFQQRKYEQAVSVLREGLKLNPALPKAGTLLAMSLSELGRFAEALPTLQQAFKASSAELKRMTGLQLQRVYTGLGRDREAVELALELNRLYPTDPEVLYHSARLFGNFAFLNMRKLAEVAPESPWKYQAAGEVYESQGKYDLAIAAYRRVLVLSPQRAGLHLRIGRALLAGREGDFEAAAEKEFAQELDLDPTNANAAYELGELYRRRGQLADAKQMFDRALTHYPNFDEAHIGLGRVLLALEQPGPALKHLQQAVKLSPHNPVPYFHLARAHQSAGNSAEQQNAMAAFRRILSDSLKRQQSGMKILSPQEITRQETDAEVTR